jgi:integrase
VILPKNAGRPRAGEPEELRTARRAERDRQIVKLTPAPPTGQEDYWCGSPDSPPMFGVRVGATGARSWVVGYRLHGRARRLTIGEFPGLSIEDARARARKARDQAFNGDDPARLLAERRKPQSTVADLAADWLASMEARRWRPKTRQEFERIVARFVEETPFGELGPSKVRRPEIRKLLDTIEADVMADRVRATLRAMFAWAVEHDRVDAVPAFPAKRAPYVARERVLDEDELRRVWRVLDGLTGDGEELSEGQLKLGRLGEAFRLMLLTAQRRGEVLSMRWADLADEKGRRVWTIPAEKTKNGRAHRVPVCTMAGQVLDRLKAKAGGSEYVFPAARGEGAPFVDNPQRMAARLWKRSSVKGATIHDLRRTAADFTARSGIPDLHVSYVLNHSGQRDAPRVTETYVKDPKRFDTAKRTALEAWERTLGLILAGKAWRGADVVPITARARA